MKLFGSGRVLIATAAFAIGSPRLGLAQPAAPPPDPPPAPSPTIPAPADPENPTGSPSSPPSPAASPVPAPEAAVPEPTPPPPSPAPTPPSTSTTTKATAANDGKTATERRLAAQAACNAHDPSCDWIMTFSSLEKLSIHRTLAALALEIEPAPWGKQIGQIRVYNEDVFAERNWLRFFNVFHITSTTASIRSLLTIDEGQSWDDELIAESARNLKDPLFTSVVALVPTKAADPAQVDLLVVTRDIWSLRLNSKLDVIEGTLTGLQVSLSENNFLGRRKTLAFSVNLDQASVLTGPLYIDKNFLGQHLDFRAQVARIYTRQSLEVFQPAGAMELPDGTVVVPHTPSGDPGGIQDDGVFRAEGSRVSVSLTKTLWSLASKWGGGTSFSYSNSISRRYYGTGIRGVDNPDTPDLEFLPREYRYKSWGVQASAIRQWGSTFKQQVEAGYSVSNATPSLLPNFPSDPATRAFFIDTVFPRSELISSPYIEYALYLPKYKTVRNIDTFDLAEDLRLGPNVLVGLRQGLKFLGSDYYFTRPSIEGGWTFPWGKDGSFRVSAGTQARIQGGEAIDNTATAQLRAVSPTLGYFRVVAQTHAETMWNDTQNGFYSLGSDSGLRAYKIGQFIGDRRFVGQVEARSVPVPFWVLRLGAVAFYEIGGAANSFSQMQLHQNIGVGLRTLVPQTARDVFRFDFAKPLDNSQRCPIPGNICFILGFDSYF